MDRRAAVDFNSKVKQLERTHHRFAATQSALLDVLAFITVILLVFANRSEALSDAGFSARHVLMS